MKKSIISFFIAACLLVSVGSAFAVSATASATIVGSLSLSQTRSLNFGWWFAPTAESTVTLTPIESTAYSTTGGIILASSASIASGKFSVTGGTASAQFDVTCDASTTLSGPGTSMSVALTPEVPMSPATHFVFDSGGNATFYVGGTLSVGINQAVGSYTGTYAVTVAYY